MEFKYAGYGLELAWTRLPDQVKSVAVGTRRSGPQAMYSRYDGAASFRLQTSGFFVANVRAKAPFDVVIGSLSRSIEREALLVVGPGQLMSCTFAGAHESEFVSMPAESIEATLGAEQSYDIQAAIYGEGEDAPIRHLVNAVTACIASREDTCALAYEAMSIGILRLIAVRGEVTKRPPTLSVDQACTVRAKILDNLAEPLSVGELAQAVQLSEGHFARAFKESFGTAPYNYILQERALRAQKLLDDHAAPLETIAKLAGFSGVAQMTRALKSRVGSTARSLRAAGPRTSGSTDAESFDALAQSVARVAASDPGLPLTPKR